MKIFDNYFRVSHNLLTDTYRLHFRVTDKRCYDGSRIDSISMTDLALTEDYVRHLFSRGCLLFLPKQFRTRLLPIV